MKTPSLAALTLALALSSAASFVSAQVMPAKTPDGRVIYPADFVGPLAPGMCRAGSAGCLDAMTISALNDMQPPPANPVRALVNPAEASTAGSNAVTTDAAAAKTAASAAVEQSDSADLNDLNGMGAFFNPVGAKALPASGRKSYATSAAPDLKKIEYTYPVNAQAEDNARGAVERWKAADDSANKNPNADPASPAVGNSHSFGR